SIGTPDGVTQVKGTLVCDTNGSAGNGNSVLVDTDLVPLSPQGDASFSGVVAVDPVCLSEADIAFLVRIGSGAWIANGSVGTPSPALAGPGGTRPGRRRRPPARRPRDPRHRRRSGTLATSTTIARWRRPRASRCRRDGPPPAGGRCSSRCPPSASSRCSGSR